MHTEMSDIVGRRRVRGWVLYDAACPLCCDLMKRFPNTLEASAFRLAPLQAPWVRELLDLPADQLLAEMCVLTRKGRILAGADALVYVANDISAKRRPWWAWLLVAASSLPLGMPVLRSGYRWIALRRQCRPGVCQVANTPKTPKEEML